MTASRIQPYELKWAKSKKLLREYVQRYNAGRPLREQLRSIHLKLAEYLLYIYGISLYKDQAFGDRLQPGSPLPPLYTNNVQIANEMEYSERTAINHRARLKLAGIILREQFHGSNGSYEIDINPVIMHLQDRQGPDNSVHLFATQGVTKQNVSVIASTEASENFSPYSIRLQKQVTNQLNKLSGADFQQSPDFQSIERNPTVEKVDMSVETESHSVENPQQNVCLDTKQDTGAGHETSRAPQVTPPPIAAAPPKDPAPGAGEAGPTLLSDFLRERFGVKLTQKPAAAPEPTTAPPPADPEPAPAEAPPAGPPATPPGTFAEAVMGLQRDLVERIRRHVITIWICALSELYSDQWVHESERERTMAILAEYFIYAHPDRYAAGASEIIERIILVKRWIARGQAAGSKRWVPIPSVYFDHRNDRGFTRTKAWYQKHIRAKAEIKSTELTTKAVRQYAASLAPGAKVGPSETYRLLSQRLGKHGKELLDRFHQQISEINAATSQTAPSGP